MSEKRLDRGQKRGDLAGTIEVLFEISDAVTHTRNLAELYKVIHQSLYKVFNVDNFYIALFDERRDVATFPYYVDEKDDSPEEILNFSRKKTFLGMVIKRKSPLIFHEKEIREIVRKMAGKSLGSISKIWMGAPLIIKGRVIGAMVIQDYNSATAY
ncbi:MAG: GAF domain-containing protein [Desulfobacteraceae bacterium]|nr:GAF domain-containing protein [Desulfobacteraceae bacterium]